MQVGKKASKTSGIEGRAGESSVWKMGRKKAENAEGGDKGAPNAKKKKVKAHALVRGGGGMGISRGKLVRTKKSKTWKGAQREITSKTKSEKKKRQNPG